MMIRLCSLLLITIAFLHSLNTNADDKINSRLYLGQNPPGDTAKLFLPDIISDGLNNRDLAISPDGTYIYYAVNMRKFDISTILYTHFKNGQWSKPNVASFAKDPNFKYLEPTISPDGQRFFFVSSAKDVKDNNDIWVMDKKGQGWSTPYKLSDNINTAVSETFPTITNDGTLYFSRVSEDPQIEHIYRSKLVNGNYGKAEKLPNNVNSGKTQFNAFIAPDESYIIVSVYGRKDSIGSIDYYITYRTKDDIWSKPINMGKKVNTKGAQEYSAYVSRDGKYLFFMSTRLPKSQANHNAFSYQSLMQIHNKPENGNSDIYWMDAKLIEELRPDGF